MTKGKGKSSSTSPSTKPSSSAKPKAQPKKNGAKGGGKGKKDKSAAKSADKSDPTLSTKSSAKSSAKSGAVTFKYADAEEEDPEEEIDWGEDEEYAAEEESMDTTADHAFATPYHSHVCVVHDLVDGDRATAGSLAFSDELFDAADTEQWTTDEDAIDTPGLTRAPNSPVAQPVPRQRSVPLTQA